MLSFSLLNRIGDYKLLVGNPGPGDWTPPPEGFWTPSRKDLHISIDEFNNLAYLNLDEENSTDNTIGTWWTPPPTTTQSEVLQENVFQSNTQSGQAHDVLSLLPNFLVSDDHERTAKKFEKIQQRSLLSAKTSYTGPYIIRVPASEPEQTHDGSDLQEEEIYEKVNTQTSEEKSIDAATETANSTDKDQNIKNIADVFVMGNNTEEEVEKQMEEWPKLYDLSQLLNINISQLRLYNVKGKDIIVTNVLSKV